MRNLLLIRVVVILGVSFAVMLLLPDARVNDSPRQDSAQKQAGTPTAPGSNQQALASAQSYFGIIKVKGSPEPNSLKIPYSQLIGGILPPGGKVEIPNEETLKKLATTYYRRAEPAGKVMEQFNWFPDAAKD